MRRAALDLRGSLYLVNYAKNGTKFEDQVLLISVKSMNENGINEEEKREFTREDFKKWFRELNKECLGPVDSILAKKPIYVRNGYYHSRDNCSFLRGKRDYATYVISDEWAYKRYRCCKECCSVLHMFLCDYSAFNSYMLLCEADGKRVLYSGDFVETVKNHMIGC